MNVTHDPNIVQHQKANYDPRHSVYAPGRESPVGRPGTASPPIIIQVPPSGRVSHPPSRAASRVSHTSFASMEPSRTPSRAGSPHDSRPYTPSVHRPLSTHQTPASQRPATLASSEAAIPVPPPGGQRSTAHTPVQRPIAIPASPPPLHTAAPTAVHGIPQDRSPVDRHGAVTPFNLGNAEDERERLEQLNEVALRLHDAALAAQEAEERRELEFRQHEEDRDRIFLEHEDRRNDEVRARAEGIWREIDTRLATLPAPAPAPVSVPVGDAPHVVSVDEKGVGQTPRPVPLRSPSASILSLHNDPESELSQADRASIASIKEAASLQLTQFLETIQLEREEFARERAEAAAEREKLLAEASVEREKLLEDRDSRIRQLEEELSKVKDELSNEREFRATEEAANREHDRQERMERDEAFQQQLGDITNLVQEQKDECGHEKELNEQRYNEKIARRQAKDLEMIELRDMVQKLHDDMSVERMKAEEDRLQTASKQDLERLVDELRQQTNEQRVLLEMFSESWRADCARHQEETINAVKSTAQEQVPYNVEGYLNEFSKALASEVRMLLGEVGKLREDRRALQHEIGYLLCMKSKYGPGGEFDPDWRPPAGPGGPGGPPPGDQPPPPPDVPEGPPDVPMARPGWRTKPKKKEKKKDRQAAAAAQAQAQTTQQYAMEQQMYTQATGQTLPRRPVASPRQQVRSWAQWHPDPAQAPSPASHEAATLQIPARVEPGLFGPPSDDAQSMYTRMG
ncbi:hypothetical protein BKA70DRAFT_1424429 [Coprinopsis sp. MPI-PUGE-AT-0042]|nr:hypothetical protein BKA70DRAFT_1424429 [Coprinopsis sp. MPI-PUGE-AT-0042]